MRIPMIWRMAAAPLLFLLLPATSAPTVPGDFTAPTAPTDQTGWQELGPGHLRCSEPAGKYNNYAIPALEPGKPVTFRFKLVSENFDPKWTVNAALFFEEPAGRTRIVVGKAQDDRSHIYLALQGAGRKDWQMLDVLPVTTDWIDVNTEMDSRGVIHVMSGKKEGSLQLGTASPVKTLLHCNSGVFEVEMLPVR
ncbi:MAG: hypothetical protein QOH86_1881 [Sphingomonadales bacterium]|jgi:hypothetical protein|nr:hypothetical protein [Sphingomonadales bacterium]